MFILQYVYKDVLAFLKYANTPWILPIAIPQTILYKSPFVNYYFCSPEENVSLLRDQRLGSFKPSCTISDLLHFYTHFFCITTS